MGENCSGKRGGGHAGDGHADGGHAGGESHAEMGGTRGVGNADSGGEIVAIIDSRDRVTAAAPRAEMRARGLMHRVNYILVFNRAGEILAMRRTAQKDIYPGLLDLAAGGVVLAGESYAASAARELQEELGVTAALTEHFSLWFEDAAHTPPNRTWGKVFSCVHEGPFRLQESEVASAEFMPVDAALALGADEVTPDSWQVLAGFVM